MSFATHVTTMTLVLAVSAAAAPALADDHDDCAGKDAKKSIAACTKLISAYQRPMQWFVAKPGEATKPAPAPAPPTKDLLDWYYNRAVAYSNSDQNELCVADYSFVIKHKPSDTDAIIGRGLCLLDMTKYEEAKADFELAVQQARWNARAHTGLGASLKGLRAYDEALKSLDTAIRLDAKIAIAYDDRAEIKADLGRFDEAIADARKALAIKDSTSARAVLARSLAGIGSHDSAIAEYDKVIAADKKEKTVDASSYLLRARSYLALGKSAKANADLDEVIKITTAEIERGGKTGDAYNGRADAYAAKKDWAKALADYDRAVKLLPNRATPLVDRADAQRLAGNADKARADYEAALKLPDDTGIDGLAHDRVTRGIEALDGQPIGIPKQLATGEIQSTITGQKFPPQNPDYSNFGQVIEIHRLPDNRLNKEDLRPDGKVKTLTDPLPAKQGSAKSGSTAAGSDGAGIVLSEQKPQNAPAFDFDLEPPKKKAEPAKPAPQPTPAPAPKPSQTAQATVTPAPAPVPVNPSVPTQRRIALVIGVSNYAHLTKLPNPGNDAKAMAALFKEHGIAPTLLLDPTHTDLLVALQNFKLSADGADLALVYFAGHGFNLAGTDVLLPKDLPERCGTLPAAEMLKGTISIDDVVAAVKPARQRVVLLDACRSDSFPSCPTRTRGAEQADAFRGLSRIETRGTLIATSTARGAPAKDGPAGGHSPFAEKLLAMLKAKPQSYFHDVLFNVTEALEAEGIQQPEVFMPGGPPRTCLKLDGCGAR